MGPWLLALAAGAMWTGILLSGSWERGLGSAMGAALICLGFLNVALAVPWRSGPRPVLALVLVASGFLSLGAGWFALGEARRAASPITRSAGRPTRVWGVLDDEPKAAMFGWTATVRTEILFLASPGPPSAISVRDRLWLQGNGSPPEASAGDRVSLEGSPLELRGDFGSYLRHRGYSATFSVVRLRKRGPPSAPWQRAAQSVRVALRGSLERLFPRREAGLLMGLLLGDTNRLDAGIEEDFRATGLSHLTAVSGQNLVMFVAPLLGLAVWAGLGRWGRLVVGVSSVGFFVLLTGGEPSVVRAAAMAGLTLLGVFLGRPRSPPAILGGAVLALLAHDPGLAYAVGFQLSVAATSGIALLASPISARLRFLPRGLALAAGATLGAQAGVTPLLLYHFGVVPVVTIPANLLAFPAVAPCMLLGLAAGAAGLAWWEAGAALAWLAGVPLGYLESVADTLARSPLPSITSPGGQLPWLLAGLAVVGAAAWLLRSGRRGRRSLVAVGLVLPLFMWSGAVRAGPPDGVTVTFFDVGQGDAALVRSPGGATILIDGGPEPDEVARKLAGVGVRRLDVMVATHPHADHVAGLATVLSRFPVALIVDPGCDADSPYYDEFLRAVDAAGVPLEHPANGAVINVADVRMEVLGPDQCFVGTDSDHNNDSLVVRLLSRSASILFAGDAEEPAQRAMLSEGAASLRATLIKVPHHGGATSLPEFIDAVGATVGVVSVGPNRYGHPSPEVLSALAASGVRVFRTDHLGDITIIFRGRQLSVSHP